MRRYLSLILLVSALLFTVRTGEANHIPTWNTQREVFKNTDCAKNNTCDLKQATFLREDYRIDHFESSHYGTRMFAAYKTDAIENLQKYAFVQFIRGCVFTSEMNGQAVTRNKNYDKPHFGNTVNFCFPNWVIDAVTTDPIDFDVEKNRHFFYRSDDLPHNDRVENRKFFGISSPRTPILFMTDHPGGTAFIYRLPVIEQKEKPVSGGYDAKNISLELKTCLYKTAEVPITANDDNLDFAKPITCFFWRSSFIYNFDRKVYESPSAIDPFCFEKDIILKEE